MSWLLLLLALGAGAATWALAVGRWEGFMDTSVAQAKLQGIRRRQSQTRLAEAIVGQLQAEK